MTKEKLLPCPFCNNDEILLDKEDDHYFVYCDNCGAEVFGDKYWDKKYQHSKESAIRLWNTRAIPDIQQDVKDFMTKAEQEIPENPIEISEETRQLRLNLCWEEFQEMMEGLGLAYFNAINSWMPWTITDENGMRDDSQPDHVKLADGVADLVYVIIGTLIAAGIDFWPIWKEVQRSNMSKFIDGHRREDGKWMKGPSYSEADIKKCLEDQGWKSS